MIVRTRHRNPSGYRCGSEAGYQAHRKRCEPICNFCRDARNTARRERYVPKEDRLAGRRRPVMDRSGGTARIPLGNEMYALIDAQDAELVGQYTWQAVRDCATWYARRDICLPGRRKKTQRMHTLITGWPFTDHRNGDGLDNRRANLRQATKAQNNRNRRKTVGRSRLKGVSLYQGRWRAQIKFAGRQTHLGSFANEDDAGRAYDAAAREHFGEFSALNFPERGERSAHTIGEMK